MQILVTAGSTQIPIDQVRCISNIFRGKTGAAIARYFIQRDGAVTLLTSSADADDLLKLRQGLTNKEKDNFHILKYRTFDDLARLMEIEIRTDKYDVIIHSAAVSDYQISRVFTDNLGTVEQNQKISSSHSKLYLELVPTIKLIDQIRRPWGFTGKLIKFKLQVGISDVELLAIAKKSRRDSEADLIVANCLEWSQDRAYIVNDKDQVESVERHNLPQTLAKALGL